MIKSAMLQESQQVEASSVGTVRVDSNSSSRSFTIVFDRVTCKGINLIVSYWVKMFQIAKYFRDQYFLIIFNKYDAHILADISGVVHRQFSRGCSGLQYPVGRSTHHGHSRAHSRYSGSF